MYVSGLGASYQDIRFVQQGGQQRWQQPSSDASAAPEKMSAGTMALIGLGVAGGVVLLGGALFKKR